ncbi:bifunctional hydroxymethylpyrimidine kinase/phosphomethylpyrimidine kinase [Cryobacterium glaciale]|uniref:Bifunctional hydroxymethylpyrimidine kinase/phosphomethylpyrimidine kinase n=1 Tax=Cryobacterium glaciale TaxID=1259145 RepID=A0A4R8V7E7_9MICO|nr:bifunctional hydroxymethylpyrimidine kinase/phosphomethylpyrimidine kinase [Cryobacterium glaciale]TFB77396.1 bifunctional hydroxymethylpyrimidine kinase/phosphomethylpyrimidine kinase [Cryobacterium glaciale]
MIDRTLLALRQIPRILSIAGTDPTGGAGIQADLKSIAANGGYGMAVVSALVAQNTRGVRSVHIPPIAFLREQLNAVSDDVTIDAVKIGMLAQLDVITEVRDWLSRCRPPLVVLDPVMVATSGDRLLDPAAEQALRDLILQVDLVTPNVPELAILLGERPAANWAEALEQGKRLSDSTGATVLVKGGHLNETSCPDALVNTNGRLAQSVVEVALPRIRTTNTHGTGCSLSSAMATVQARTGDWAQSLAEVKDWLQDALAHADELGVGQGNGPIHHFHRLFADSAGTSPIPAGSAAFSSTPTFSSTLWRDVELTRLQIFDLPFITDLGSGTLAEEDFSYYLAQDALYLGTYASVLARASELAPTASAQCFLADSAARCRDVELELHRSWLGQQPEPSEAGPVTTGYLEHLLAAGAAGNYAVLLAALLPCFWLYANVGDRLHAAYLSRTETAAHPYAAWLETYSDEEFAAATKQAIALTDDVAATASNAERAAMRQAFATSARFELDFFDAPRQLVRA